MNTKEENNLQDNSGCEKCRCIGCDCKPCCCKYCRCLKGDLLPLYAYFIEYEEMDDGVCEGESEGNE